ncbi:MAG TPA: Ig-like domain-containing protein [Acidimicrobiia bacterium]|nr:Ig-like domain-containing protein [Acidimicrobiia bacterium]
MGVSRQFRAVRRVAFAALTAAFAVGGLIAAAPAAHATIPCTNSCTAPAASDDFYNVAYNTKLTVAKPGVLANDDGPTGTHVDIADTTDTGTDCHINTFNGNADVCIHSDGSFTYTPDPSGTFAGQDSFDYEAEDADNNESWATVTITVAPVITNDTYSMGTSAASLTVDTAHGVLANDLGVDAAATSLTIDSSSAHGGTVTDNLNGGGFTYTPPAGFSGTDTFGYTVMDSDDDLTWPLLGEALVTIYVDSTPPTVAMSAGSGSVISTSTTLKASWLGSDGAGGTGIDHYDVYVNYAPYSSGFTGWKLVQSNTSTSVSYSGGYGRTYCFKVYAFDKAGNESAAAQSCQAIPLKASSLSYSTGWSTATSSVYFGGSARYTKTYHAKVTRSSIQATRIYIIASKCSTCGYVSVNWGSTVLGTVKLTSSTTVHKQILLVLKSSTVKSGTLTITVTTSNRNVVIEGLGIYRYN